MTPAARPLAARFRDHVRGGGAVEDGACLVVALSGGADSVALLHLLRFTPGLPGITVVAAHVDHGMRAGSGDDAAWVQGLCRAWDVPLRLHRLAPPPSTEAQARRARYDWLEEVRQAEGATWVATAHHADDQAETVLFRAVRGTGLAGLQGIRERREPGVWRPLLGLTREELRGYAVRNRLGWREDASNRLPFARNVLRNRIIPELERRVAPGARRSLAGLARRARQDMEAWASVEDLLLRGASVRREGQGVSLDRTALVSLHPLVRARLLRALALELGYSPSEAGTRRAVEFTSAGSSGSWIPLGGGLVLRRELERFHLGKDGATAPDTVVTIPGREAGSGHLTVGGLAFEVSWFPGPGPGPDTVEGEWAVFRPEALTFPLAVRGWRPGDRVRLGYGTKKLKKVLLEARIPPGRRHGLPVVVDAAGAVLWVPGVVRADDTLPTDEDDAITIGIIDAQPD